MKALKRILLVVVVIILLVVVIGFLLPRTIRVERSMLMKAHQGLVFNQVSILRNWENWDAWHKMDTAMKITYSGPGMGKGASYSWESANRNLGNGSLSISLAEGMDSVFTTMSFGDRGTAEGRFYFIPEEGGTMVKWIMESDMGVNPIGRYFGLFMESEIGRSFDSGLSSMKAIVEANPNAMMKVDTASVQETNYVYIRETVSLADISDKMGEFYGEIVAFMQAKNVGFAGSPFSLYHSWEGGSFDMEAGIPYMGTLSGEGRIRNGTLKAGKVVKCDYYGPYEGTDLPHKVIEKYLAEKGMKLAGSPWEVYVTDPMTEPDPGKWLTVVYWPVE